MWCGWATVRPMTTPGGDPNDTAPFSSPLNGPWALYGDIPEVTLSSVPLGDADEWERQLWRASELLWSYSGRQWRGAGGHRDVVVRSVAPRPADRMEWPYDRSWGSCRCWGWGSFEGMVDPLPVPPVGYEGGHLAPRAIRLPDRDVTAVTEVLVDQEPFTAWRLSDTGWLMCTSPRGGWPVCGDRLMVGYSFGFSPPVGGVEAAVELTRQYALSVLADDRCQLPSRLASLTRQAVALTFESSQDVATKRLTGVPSIDSWITSVNPYLRPAEGLVVTPDVPIARS